MADDGPSGRDWIDTFLQAEAHVGFNTHWLMFTIGQVGAFAEVVRYDPSRLPHLDAMIEQFGGDITDFEDAAARLVRVARDLQANAQRSADRAR